ncbi:MAG: hypothetical protein WCA20_22015, partial [Candidatus Sulfotelmatobacter sp.]
VVHQTGNQGVLSPLEVTENKGYCGALGFPLFPIFPLFPKNAGRFQDKNPLCICCGTQTLTEGKNGQKILWMAKQTLAEKFRARYADLCRRKQFGCPMRALHEEMTAASTEKIHRLSRPYNFPDGSSFNFVRRTIISA